MRGRAVRTGASARARLRESTLACLRDEFGADRKSSAFAASRTARPRPRRASPMARLTTLTSPFLPPRRRTTRTCTRPHRTANPPAPPPTTTPRLLLPLSPMRTTTPRLNRRATSSRLHRLPRRACTPSSRSRPSRAPNSMRCTLQRRVTGSSGIRGRLEERVVVVVVRTARRARDSLSFLSAPLTFFAPFPTPLASLSRIIISFPNLSSSLYYPASTHSPHTPSFPLLFVPPLSLSSSTLGRLCFSASSFSLGCCLLIYNSRVVQSLSVLPRCSPPSRERGIRTSVSVATPSSA
jgi:hypothetical protein